MITVHEVAYHRNGVCGEGFYACRFTDHELGHEFVATVFPPAPVASGSLEGEADWFAPHNPRVAVLALDLLPSVEFGVNSWRGDQYADALYHAIVEGIGATV